MDTDKDAANDKAMGVRSAQLDAAAMTPPSKIDPFDANSKSISPTVQTPRRYLDITEIKKARDFKTADVEVPEWGGPDHWITLKALTGKERDAFETSLRIKRNGKADVSTLNMRAKLVVLCAIKSPTDQSRLFSDEDASWLGDKSSAVLSRLYDKASEISGFSEKDTEDLENVAGN